MAAWAVIGQYYVTGAQSFFLIRFLRTGVNATIMSLIPKSENVRTMKDYHRMACCNLLYKVISKVLANRLKTLLPRSIESNQCAFIKGKLLLENVLLASELVNCYHKKTNLNRCTIKFDIFKAFDTVKCSFISFSRKRACQLSSSIGSWCLSPRLPYMFLLTGALKGSSIVLEVSVRDVLCPLTCM